MNQQKQVSTLRPWFIWGLAAFFFFAHYVVRVTPGHISEELQLAFEISKSELGILGMSFYIPYVLMQMPIGYLVDRFGSRALLTAAVLICSVSSFIFANSEIVSTAMLSRILLGFSSATAFIGALKLITVWFDARKLALLVGITQALGMVGAAVGGHLVPVLNDKIGWEDSFRLYGVVFFALSILIFSVVRNSPQNTTSSLNAAISTTKITFTQIKSVLLSKYTWINALYAGFIYAPTDCLGEFWGKEFLRNIHHLDSHSASHSIAYLFFGWAIGGPIAGWLADHVGRRPVMIGSAILGFILLPIVFYVPNIPLPLISTIVFIYGLTNTGLIASYTAAGELHDKSLGGFSMAIANMFSVLVGAGLMWVLGALLDWSAAKNLAFTPQGALMHSAQDYQYATIVITGCLFLAIICSFFTKETLTDKRS
ncbi:MAG: MFS transporter [Proteobacteria bacterium]|nr:MFS transporter [Pseudomonadota bacterium]